MTDSTEDSAEHSTDGCTDGAGRPGLPERPEQPDPPDLGELAARLGIVLDSLEPGRAVGHLPVEGNRQPFGLLNGGASAALVETIGSILAVRDAAPDGSAVGIELSVSHHLGVRAGTVTAVATALHTGRTVASYEVALTDDAGRRIATGRLTCAIRRAGAGTARGAGTGADPAAATAPSSPSPHR